MGETRDRLDNSRISNLPASRTEFKHSGLTAGAGYYYRIRAVNDADGDGTPGEEGEVSIWSGASETATTRAAVLGTHIAPTIPSAAMVDNTGQLNLIWTAPTVTDGVTRAPITRYEIQFRQDDDATDDGAANAWDGAESKTPTPPTNAAYSHTGLEGGKRYVYRVRAINAVGSGAWSADFSQTTDTRPPDAPELTATALSNTEILLEWNVPADNGTPFTGFSIQQWDPDLDNAGASSMWTTTNLLLTGGDDPDDLDISVQDDLTVFTVDMLSAGVTYLLPYPGTPHWRLVNGRRHECRRCLRQHVDWRSQCTGHADCSARNR